MDQGTLSYEKYLAGDDEGLYEIVRDYRDGLILYINSLIRDFHTSEDLAEDTFVRLFVKKPVNRKEKGSFRTWLYTIGRNIALDHLRKNSRSRISGPEDLEDRLTEEEDPEKLLLKKEKSRILYEALIRLTEDQRQVLYLKYFETLPSKEIARIMRKTVRNVDTLAYRGRQALKDELLKEGFTDEDL